VAVSMRARLSMGSGMDKEFSDRRSTFTKDIIWMAKNTGKGFLHTRMGRSMKAHLKMMRNKDSAL
jgi:hypothetical protein